MKKKFLTIFFPLLLLHASDTAQHSLTLDEALQVLKAQNLEIKAANYDEKVAQANTKTVSGMNWGKLDFQQDFARSDDAGNVFGFKLTSREATFGDFGFDQFISQMDTITPGSPTFDGGTKLLATQPDKLNYPEDRNFYQTKLKYELPIFTGFKISSYTDIMEAMAKMKSLDKKKVYKEKQYQLKKSFYDMALLKSSIAHLNVIYNNIKILENTTKEMIDVGYAKKVDLLEVQSKKANVKRLLIKMEANEQLLYHFISFLLNEKVTDIVTPTNQVPMPHFSDEEILANNLDIQKAKTGLEIRNDMISANEAGLYYPMVGAFAEIGTADDTFLGDANDHKAYTVGARLTWNIFNGGIDGAKVEKAKLEKLKTASQVELAKKGIMLQIAKIRTEITSLDSEIASLRKELELADTIYANYEGRYKEKLVSMNDVIIKQSQQIEKILQLQMAINKRTERVFALEKLANGEE